MATHKLYKSTQCQFKCRQPDKWQGFEEIDQETYESVREEFGEINDPMIICALLNQKRQQLHRNNQIQKREDTKEERCFEPLKECCQKSQHVENQMLTKNNSSQFTNFKRQLVKKALNQRKRRLQIGHSIIKQGLQSDYIHSNTANLVLQTCGNGKEVTSSEIASLYAVNTFQELIEKVYLKQPEEDPFFFEVFKRVFNSVKTELICPPQDVNIYKVRTFIIRRVLDDYVYDGIRDMPFEDRYHVQQTQRRLTRKDKEHYQKSGIQAPKSRIEKPYLLQLFKNKSFCEYYKKYIESDRLKRYLKFTIDSGVEGYQNEIQSISRMNLTLEQKLKKFKKISIKPLVFGNIMHYESEARIVLIDYYKK